MSRRFSTRPEVMISLREASKQISCNSYGFTPITGLNSHRKRRSEKIEGKWRDPGKSELHLAFCANKYPCYCIFSSGYVSFSHRRRVDFCQDLRKVRLSGSRWNRSLHRTSGCRPITIQMQGSIPPPNPYHQSQRAWRLKHSIIRRCGEQAGSRN